MATLDYQPGQQLPGTVYKVLRLIGVGGMGSVYDVEDTTIGKRYVVKTLHPKLGAREDLARRVLKEARTLARLNHPNIVEVITAGVTTDDLKLPYYVMERLNGQSLRVVLDKKGRLEISHAYHIGIDLLDALDHAHDKGLIHRDVKPDNIFLHRTPAGTTLTKLLDFGIVSVLDGGTTETAGRFLGTLRYAAPEQLRGESPTPKMDVYAAALVIYEIVAGRGPFDDQGDASAVGAAHLNKLPPRLSHLVPGVPRELDNLLVAALDKDPRRRPRDAFSFAASLRNLNRQFEASARRGSVDTRATASGVTGLVTDPPAPPSASVESTRPAPAVPTPTPSGAKTTLVGMEAPTVGPPPPGSGTRGTRTTTARDPLDRLAATQSVDTDVAQAPPHGTEALDGPSLSALAEQAEPPAPAEDGATLPSGPPSDLPPIEWPVSTGQVRSVEPQVRSVPVGALLASASGTRRAGRAVIAAALGAGMMAAMAVALVARRGPADADRERLVAPAAAARAPMPIQQEIVPAPVLAPPAFDLGELQDTKSRAMAKALPSGEASAAVSAPPALPSAPAVPAASMRYTGAPKAAPTTNRSVLGDRPGPGF
jgi:serine/threonine-protein kinase